MNATPVFTGELSGKPLRFFASPHNGPRYVWTAEDDLAKAIGVNRLQRRIIRQLHDEGTMDGAAMLIKTCGRVEVIVDYTSARSLIVSIEMSNLRARGEIERAALIHSEKVITDVELAFIRQVQHAMDIITAGMSSMESLDYIIACAKAEGGHA